MESKTIHDYFLAFLAFMGGGGATLLLAWHNARQTAKRKQEDARRHETEEDRDFEVDNIRLEFENVRLVDYITRLENMVINLDTIARKDDPELKLNPELSGVLRWLNAEIKSRPKTPADSTGRDQAELRQNLRVLIEELRAKNGPEG